MPSALLATTLTAIALRAQRLCAGGKSWGFPSFLRLLLALAARAHIFFRLPPATPRVELPWWRLAARILPWRRLAARILPWRRLAATCFLRRCFVTSLCGLLLLRSCPPSFIVSSFMSRHVAGGASLSRLAGLWGACFYWATASKSTLWRLFPFIGAATAQKNR